MTGNPMLFVLLLMLFVFFSPPSGTGVGLVSALRRADVSMTGEADEYEDDEYEDYDEEDFEEPEEVYHDPVNNINRRAEYEV